MALRKEKKDTLAVTPEEKMQITARRPYDIWADFDHMFNTFRSNFDDLFWPWRNRNTIFTPFIEQRMPSMNVADAGDHYEMQLEMPGVTKDNVDIQVTQNTIEIKAECDDIKEENGKNWLRRECSGMSFYRALELPEEVKADHVNAELKDGVLMVHLPKVEPKLAYKPKKVEIK